MDKLLLGIDGGGTRCRARISDSDGTPLGNAFGGSANIMTDMDGAQHTIVRVTQAALVDAQLDVSGINCLHAVIGVAGANIGDNAARLQKILPFKQCHVENDSTIALHGALGKADGVVALFGTGSVFILRHRGVITTKGGWGPIVGDQASGAALGKRLLSELLLCHDGIYPKSALYTHTMNSFDNRADDVVQFAHSASPADFAKFAKSVMDSAATDSMAKRIVKSAVEDIELILGRITPDNNLPVCLLGGLGSRYAVHLSAGLKKRLIPPIGNALSGAIAMAVEQYCDS